MELKTTRAKLWDLFSNLSTNEIIDYLESYGLEFVEPAFEEPAHGIYRRENGTDLIRYSYGEWSRVDHSFSMEKL